MLVTIYFELNGASKNLSAECRFHHPGGKMENKSSKNAIAMNNLILQILFVLSFISEGKFISIFCLFKLDGKSLM